MIFPFISRDMKDIQRVVMSLGSPMTKGRGLFLYNTLVYFQLHAGTYGVWYFLVIKERRHLVNQ